MKLSLFRSLVFLIIALISCKLSVRAADSQRAAITKDFSEVDPASLEIRLQFQSEVTFRGNAILSKKEDRLIYFDIDGKLCAQALRGGTVAKYDVGGPGTALDESPDGRSVLIHSFTSILVVNPESKFRVFRYDSRQTIELPVQTETDYNLWSGANWHSPTQVILFGGDRSADLDLDTLKETIGTNEPLRRLESLKMRPDGSRKWNVGVASTGLNGTSALMISDGEYFKILDETRGIQSITSNQCTVISREIDNSFGVWEMVTNTPSPRFFAFSDDFDGDKFDMEVRDAFATGRVVFANISGPLVNPLNNKVVGPGSPFKAIATVRRVDSQLVASILLESQVVSTNDVISNFTLNYRDSGKSDRKIWTQLKAADTSAERKLLPPDSSRDLLSAVSAFSFETKKAEKQFEFPLNPSPVKTSEPGPTVRVRVTNGTPDLITFSIDGSPPDEIRPNESVSHAVQVNSSHRMRISGNSIQTVDQELNVREKDVDVPVSKDTKESNDIGKKFLKSIFNRK